MENSLEVTENKKTDKVFELTDNILDRKSETASFRAQLETEIGLKIISKDDANYLEQQAVRKGDFSLNSENTLPTKELIEDLDKSLWMLQEDKQEEFNKDIDSLLEHAIESRNQRAEFLGKFSDQLEQRADVYLATNAYEKTAPNLEAAKDFVVDAQIGKDFMTRMNAMTGYEENGKKFEWDREPMRTNGVGNSMYEDMLKQENLGQNKSLPTAITKESALGSRDLFEENHKQYMGLVGIKENRDTEKERKQNLDSLYKEIDSELKALRVNREKANMALGITEPDKVFGNEKSGLKETLNRSNKSLESMALGLKDTNLIKHREEVLERATVGQGKAQNPIEEKMRVQHAAKHKEPLEAVKSAQNQTERTTSQENNKNKGRSM